MSLMISRARLASVGAGMPRERFVQVLFGHHSFETLRQHQPDVWANDEEAHLLQVLFPPQLSRPVLLN